jgi:ribosomal protein S18 acetylase RimI-like enzyme
VDVRALQSGDLPELEELWAAGPWATQIADLRAIAADAARPRPREHRGLCSTDDGGTVAGVVLFRAVPGAVGTGEIECVAARTQQTARMLLDQAVTLLRSEGARLLVAEFPGGPEWREYESLLESAGFSVRASVADYFADGVPLRIAVA